MALPLTKRAISVLALTTIVCLTALLSLVWGVVMWVRLGNLRVNHVGDPEKEFTDECMRDFEGLPVEDESYRANQRRCVDELAAKEKTAWLPHIRLTVDDRVCDSVDICRGGDPADCADQGDPFQDSYQPGAVTLCYQLIAEAKAELAPRRQSELFDEVRVGCTGEGVWSRYENRVQLEYCMFKHLSVGLCTNRLRTNCPPDTSCCPIAQNYLETDSETNARPDQYICMKSPTVGLYCHQLDYRATPDAAAQVPEAPPVGNISLGNSSAARGNLCTAATCTRNFGWCRDFADVPGECLGEACQEYSRALAAATACIALAIAGLFCDAADVLILVRWRSAAVPKSVANFAGSCLKLLAYLCCLAGGVKDFAHTIIDRSCFTAPGNDVATAALQGVDAFLLCTLVASVASLLLAPLSVYHGGRLVGLPYARVQEHTAV